MRFFLLIIFVCISTFGFSQSLFSRENPITILKNKKSIPNPFTPGINAAQIQRMDVNGNGNEEFVIWDINARRILVFEENGENFKYLPELADYFPADVNGYLVLVDYDGDGRKDLFTSSPFGIKAYRNVSTPQSNSPTWQVAQNFLRLNNGSNVTANNLDIPLIMDLDGDGDLDIATFNFASGDYLELYINTSVERKGIPDIDGFAFPKARWGNFEFCGCGSFSFGITCSGLPISRTSEAEDSESDRIMHSGGHSILYTDMDGDGIPDLLMGQDECNTLYYLPNKGTTLNPLFDEFSTSLPSFGQVPEFPIFHTASLWQNQLLITSNTSSKAGAVNADFSNNMFKISQEGDIEQFLQSDLLDFGENSRPFFRGSKEIGELIVTANSLVGNHVLGVAHRVKVSANTWEVMERDYLNLSRFKLSDIQYFEYRSAAGVNTFWLTGVDTVNFALVRKMFYSTSPDMAAKTEIQLSQLTSRPADQLNLFTYQNRDYILIAKQSGELILGRMDFTGSGVASVEQRNFLGFSDSPATRNLAVYVHQTALPSLYAVDQRGVINYINDFMNSNQRETLQILQSNEELKPSRLGRNTFITGISNPFDTNPDLILGSTGGGLEYLSAINNTDIPTDTDLLVKVYPNPSRGRITLVASQVSNVTIYNAMGQLVLADLVLHSNQEATVYLDTVSPGLYIARFTNEKGTMINRKIIITQ